MDKLLQALRSQDQPLIGRLASDLFFIENTGEINMAQVNEFEHYAPCKIEFLTQRTVTGIIKGGMIKYGGRRYFFA